VPKNLWSKRISPDELNRIQLCCRVMLLEGEGRKILVDVGSGNKWSEKLRAIYDIKQTFTGLLSEKFTGITDVILSHLHFDHGGGVTQRVNDEIVLTFPDANVYLQRANYEQALNPGVREKASYLPEHVLPLKNAKLKLSDGESEILPGIRVARVDGHTVGMQYVLIGNGQGGLVYPADLIPTAHHLSVPYVMGYDMCAATSIREKEKFLERAVSEGWTIVFEHDADTAAATVTKDERGDFVVRERHAF
jgi:glyoxylase-like metal-dependent hydrolase (beta-lactamase superfamily II)